MCCSRYKRICMCTPRPRSCRFKGAGRVYPFFQLVLSFLQYSCIQVCLFQNRAKRQNHIGLLALFFGLVKSHNMIKELL